jgi:hypothetical protein
MEELKIEDLLTLALIPIFLLMFSTNVVVRTSSERPNCMPDYRPGYKCLVFEKLPY